MKARHRLKVRKGRERERRDTKRKSENKRVKQKVKDRL